MAGGIEFAEVAARLDCETFARHEMNVVRGRAPCPFHGGKNRNLAIYRDGVYCHKCHKSANVIQLAAQIWGVDLLTAARMLNDEFRLGLDDSGPPTAEERQRRQLDRKARAAEQQAEREAWAAAADELRESERAAARFTIADAERAATWAAIGRYALALDKWNAMWAGLE